MMRELTAYVIVHLLKDAIKKFVMSQYPLSDEFEDTFNKYSCWLCCWQTEPVKISVRVPMRGYVPGQAIEITINVDNKSNQKYDNFTSNIFKVNLHFRNRSHKNDSIP